MDFVNTVSKSLAKIKNGDDKEFEALYNMTFYHLFGLAKIYLIDKNKAEDVVIDAYTKIYMYISTYKEDENGYNWMCKIVQNAAYYQNNLDKKNDAVINSLIESFDANNSQPINVDAKIDLLNAIDKLDEKSRELIYSYFYYGKKLKEIAQELNISTPGVKKKIDKIIKNLKKIYK